MNNSELLPKSRRVPTLRDYQTAALDSVKSTHESGVKRQLVVMATGLGKTPLFCSLATHMGFSGRIMVLAHREELVEQAAKKLRVWNRGAKVGIEKADRRAGKSTLVVASVQTIGRQGSKRLQEFRPEEFDALVIDEAHHAAADSYGRIIDHFTQNPKLMVLGVTATPSRADGRGLDSVFETISYKKDLLSGVRDGWLTPPRGILVPTDTDISSVHTAAGDFDAGELASEVNTPARNALTVESWERYCQGRQTVVFTVDVQHARDLADAFRSREIRAEPIWGTDPERAKKLAAHRKGQITVLCNAQLLTEGYDDWRVSAIVLAKPTKSGALYTQIIGRGTRIEDGIGNLKIAIASGVEVKKRDCIVLDLVDNSGKHRLVTLPTLLGMDQNADLGGMDFEDAAQKIKEIREEHPQLDIERIKTLAGWAQEVNLFGTADCPQEITSISKNSWFRSGTDRYSLSLSRQYQVVVTADLLGHWNAVTFKEGERLDYPSTFDSLESAIRAADWSIPAQYRNLIDRNAKWRTDNPTDKQLATCQKLGIRVPDGATKGQVSALITAKVNSFQNRYAS